mmetsp:Transcript_44674/g.50079  ORF Transcript_44674/g.50079 Transcript_44674/m.50079 type:complete len:1101 (-) Transcript_44674:107-3409(-)|eukprot:CAMPEP_0170781686 /NCGR_PEP_ID=MMETSP0733-20121128/14366_1 /TAXON_ID=186038 /ORGANISM="Fragilariopsis kerguelensis, Strain L26-C5" /LENGTH=1100 /DNA_ID=CAMNT_0011125811 /DNA_START=54 /DNA_END=3356 /DNA_ORIENTATION=-
MIAKTLITLVSLVSYSLSWAPSTSILASAFSNIQQGGKRGGGIRIIETSRKMSLTTQASEKAVIDDKVAIYGDDNKIFTIRRTAAIVMSMAVQRVLPGAVKGSIVSTWIDDGFYCEFTRDESVDSNIDNDNNDLKYRIKEEMDAIIASAAPIVSKLVSIEEAQRMAGDNEILLHQIEDIIRKSEVPHDSDIITICEVGESWWELCDNSDNISSASDPVPYLANAGLLDSGAIALTSICSLSKDEEKNGAESSVQRIAATAWETESELVSYKTRVEKSQGVIRNFGQLVNWGSGSLDGLEYTCLCCNPTEDLEGYGLGPSQMKMGPNQMLRQKTRLTEESGPKIDTANNSISSAKIGGAFVPTKNPEWLQKREAIYDTIRVRREAELAAKPTVPIEVTLPDGTVLGSEYNLTSWRTTPLDVARCISDGLANVAVVSRVRYTGRVGSSDAVVVGDGIEYDYDADEEDVRTQKAELWDLTRPLEGNCDIEILTFGSNDDAAKAVFWHSSAHILGQSLEHNYGALLTIGPPVAGGFYYDAYMGDGEGLSETQFGEIEDEFRKSVKRKEKFERLVVTKQEALDLFTYSPFKSALIQAKVPDGTRTTVYRNGDLIDLCMGPHVPHTGKIKAFKMLRCSATQWLGDVNNDQLQRVYGISFPTKKMLKAHVENLERAKERDHRRLGIEQKLFMFHPLSPGSAFFLPRGTIVYNALSEFIRTQYRKRGYSEVISPNIFNLKLWEQSGHAQHYKDDMFIFDVEGEEWGMKPMNCPAHCLMFASTTRSYRELPMRIADFGVLHRNEQSGALSGLTRVRRFQQDDAHIFCQEDQIEEEVEGCLEFMKFVYDTFGMTYQLELSTRPKKALGEKVLWDKAETALASAMNNFAGKGNWRENPGDGAFYGPKIDIKVMDAMDRVHQCATIQLDFQLPIRFDLRYKKKGEVIGDKNDSINVDSTSTTTTTESNEDVGLDDLPPDFARPVMVHRAMLGSVERMFAVLLEHYEGKWPFWLSPRQALVIPVGMDFVRYGKVVVDRLRVAGFHADIDDSNNTLKKKVRKGQLAQYNYILVVGEKEETNDSVAVRNRINEQEGEKKVDEVILDFTNLCDTYK